LEKGFTEPPIDKIWLQNREKSRRISQQRKNKRIHPTASLLIPSSLKNSTVFNTP